MYVNFTKYSSKSKFLFLPHCVWSLFWYHLLTVFSLADLRDISNEDIYVDEVIHKAVIEVNEEGSEAAAASIVKVNTRSRIPNPKPQILAFDRPFLFTIHDVENQVPLFMGRVVDPRNDASEKENCFDVNPGKISFPCQQAQNTQS